MAVLNSTVVTGDLNVTGNIKTNGNIGLVFTIGGDGGYTWVADDGYWPYYALLSTPGITSDSFVEVTFVAWSPDEASQLSNFSPVCNSENNQVRVWSKSNSWTPDIIIKEVK